jgi:hypothetical protein
VTGLATGTTMSTMVSLMAVSLLLTRERAGAQTTGELQGEYSLCSGAFQGNILGDPKCRKVSFTLPRSYWQRQSGRGGAYVIANYPVVVMLTGNNMYRNEGTIDALVRHRRPFLTTSFPEFVHFKFDQDAIAYNLMTTGQTPEFILIEISGLSSYGSTRYDCSPIFGDMRSFVARDLTRDLAQRFRIHPSRDRWILCGFSMGAGGALAVKLQDRENRWGTLVMISPSNNDLSMLAPSGEPILISLYRASPQIPQTNVPVNRVSGPKETAVSWGDAPGGGRFITGSVIATYQVVAPDVTGTYRGADGVTPLYARSPLTGPKTGQYDSEIWSQVASKGLKAMINRSGENLTDTVVIVARGNNRLTTNPANPIRIVLLSEVPDQPMLLNTLSSRGLLDAEIQTQGDHFTSLPHTFPAAIRKAFELAGSKKGRTFTYNPTIEREHAPCAAMFRRGHED